MKQYVLGFAIDTDALTVLVIKKKRPKWQENLYNGIGGHIEDGETPIAAMVREFKEETGIDTIEKQWQNYLTMKGPDWNCECFKAFDISIADAETMSDEEVEIIGIDSLMHVDIVSNLLWLVHMATDSNYASSDNTYFAEVTYS